MFYYKYIYVYIYKYIPSLKLTASPWKFPSWIWWFVSFWSCLKTQGLNVGISHITPGKICTSLRLRRGLRVISLGPKDGWTQIMQATISQQNLGLSRCTGISPKLGWINMNQIRTSCPSQILWSKKEDWFHLLHQTMLSSEVVWGCNTSPRLVNMLQVAGYTYGFPHVHWIKRQDMYNGKNMVEYFGFISSEAGRKPFNIWILCIFWIFLELPGPSRGLELCGDCVFLFTDLVESNDVHRIGPANIILWTKTQ